MPSGFTFSLLFCLLRENVEMESVGREPLVAALGVFSGEYVNARVADGVLLCEEVLVVPAEVLVRRDALRDRRRDEPMSVTEDAIECLLACLRCCWGVVGALGLSSYWLGTRGVSSGVVTGGRLIAGGEAVVVVVVRVYVYESEAREPFACPLLPLEPKKEGRLEKRPELAAAEVLLGVLSAIVLVFGGFSSMVPRRSISGVQWAHSAGMAGWLQCWCASYVMGAGRDSYTQKRRAKQWHSRQRLCDWGTAEPVSRRGAPHDECDTNEW